MVQVVITLIGLITILAGVLPFVGSLAGLPLSIVSGVGYSIIISIIGILGLIYGFTSMALIGETKFVMISLGLLTLFGGIIPFVKNIMPIAIPTAGVLYSGIIIVIGVVGFIYGMKHF